MQTVVHSSLELCGVVVRINGQFSWLAGTEALSRTSSADTGEVPEKLGWMVT